MTVTRQGVKFARQDKPGAVAFIDVGRVIKVYDQGDSSLLASLRLAQQKWGGVQVNGTNEYKRRCAELAALHGIRLTNPELQGVMKQTANDFPKNTDHAPIAPLSLKKAQKIVVSEMKKLRARHMELYDAYHEHIKALQAHIDAEPEKPLLLGVKKWEQDHAQWSAEKDALRKTIAEELKSLGCVMDFMKEPERAEKEAERLHGTYKDWTLQEAAKMHPEAARVVQEENARREKEEREARKAKETAERQEEERRAALYREAKKLMRLAGMDKMAFVHDGFSDGRRYTGEILGVIPWEGKFVAVQKISPEMAILQRFTNFPEGLTVGARLTLARDGDGNISLVPEQEKARSEYRGR
jgi:hypothetical protein